MSNWIWMCSQTRWSSSVGCVAIYENKSSVAKSKTTDGVLQRVAIWEKKKNFCKAAFICRINFVWHWVRGGGVITFKHYLWQMIKFQKAKKLKGPMCLNSNDICQLLRKTAWSPSYTLALAVHWVVTSSDAGRFVSCVHTFTWKR